MVFLIDLLIAFLLALLLTGVFAVGFRGHRGGTELWIFFLILFLLTWAGGIWIAPAAPFFVGFPWLTFLLVGLLFALLLTALIPGRPPRTGHEAVQQAQAAAGAYIALDIFFWVLIIGLFIAIIVAYL